MKIGLKSLFAVTVWRQKRKKLCNALLFLTIIMNGITVIIANSMNFYILNIFDTIAIYELLLRKMFNCKKLYDKKLIDLY